jgi:ABC-type spermidine/putrescine transport system permease subunit II
MVTCLPAGRHKLEACPREAGPVLRALHHGVEGAQGLSAAQMGIGAAVVVAAVAVVASLAWAYARRRYRDDRFK